jgi:hypothetical protein
MQSQAKNSSASQASAGAPRKSQKQGKGMTKPAKLSSEELKRREEALKKKPRALPTTPTTPPTAQERAVQADSVPPTQVNASSAKVLPQASVNATTNDLGPHSSSTIDEPSVASDGTNVLMTWNWFSAISTDSEATWTYYDPSTLFPNDYGGWCCDSVAIYDGSRNLFIWNLLYLANAGGGAFRLAVANGGANLATASFYYWDLTPQQVGGAVGDWYDYPKIALSNNYAYLQTNVFHAGALSSYQTVVMRFSLDDLAAGGGLGYLWFSPPGVSSIAFSNGATGTMYFAGHLSTSTLRLFNWAESSGTIFWDDVGHVSYPSGGFTCPRTSAANSDWCGRSDDRPLDGWVSNGIIGFSWDAPAGQWGFSGSAPYPYTHIVRIDELAKTRIDDPVVWNPGFAFMYMSHYPNTNGDLGGTFMYGGGSLFEDGGTYIWDGLGRDFVGMVGSDQDVTAGGDYLATRAVGTGWVGTMYAVLADGVHPFSVRFGR